VPPGQNAKFYAALTAWYPAGYHMYVSPTPSGGTFTITWEGQTTAPISWTPGMNSSIIQAALEALPNIGAGNVLFSVITSPDPGAPVWSFDFYIFFVNDLGGDQPAPTADVTGLTGPDAPYGVTVTNRWGTYPGRWGPVYPSGDPSLAGTFTFSYGGYTTAPIDLLATPEEVTTALEALPSTGSGNVVVTDYYSDLDGWPWGGPTDDPWYDGLKIEFVGDLGERPITGLAAGTDITGEPNGQYTGPYTILINTPIPGVMGIPDDISGGAWPTPDRNLMPRKAGRGRLGCGINEAYITWKCGTPRFCPVLEGAEITWGRTLNDISEAEVVVPLSGTADSTCCDCLGDVEPWCHELHVARDGQDVWLGPITEIVYEFDKVTIRAIDLLGWSTVRVPEVPIDYTVTTGAGAADWTTIAQAVLDVAFAEDDPCLLPYVSASLTGYVGEQKFAPYQDTAFDQIDALAATGLEYTVVGRTVILTSPNVPNAAIATLLDEHIVGDVQLTKTGLLQADRWFVHYENDDTDTPPGPGYREAANQYCYGLIERIRSTDTALANKESAEVVAQVYVDATAIAPRLLEIPDGSQLSPETPWTIDAMIPGVRVDVGVTRLCVNATQSFRLTGVQVRQTAAGAEEVSVSLGPLNVLSEGL